MRKNNLIVLILISVISCISPVNAVAVDYDDEPMIIPLTRSSQFRNMDVDRKRMNNLVLQNVLPGANDYYKQVEFAPHVKSLRYIKYNTPKTSMHTPYMIDEQLNEFNVDNKFAPLKQDIYVNNEELFQNTEIRPDVVYQKQLADEDALDCETKLDNINKKHLNQYPLPDVITEKETFNFSYKNNKRKFWMLKK